MRRALVLGLLAALTVGGPAGADPPPPGLYTEAGSSSAAGTPAGPAARGYALYGANCATCHGSNGQGVRPAEPGRGVGATTRAGPSLRNAGALAADFYLRTGFMPLRSVGSQPTRSRVLFSEQELESLVAYVASLGHGPRIPTPHPERGSLADGLRLFTEHCAGCHQIVGEGGVVTGARVPPLEDATAVEIAEAVRIGPYLMPRFPASQIDDRDLDSIIRYVRYAKHPHDAGGWAIGHLGPLPEGLVAWLIGGSLLVAVCVLIARRRAT